ncbi:MAG: HTH-type transcriptional regulator MalT [Syntrophorhabdus sp. PtaU1.Bin153]|nr:MAG: HTH-type transcriptional regulator MalT [Syntrophorhabdus sp. PtaU1.Bin153]
MTDRFDEQITADGKPQEEPIETEKSAELISSRPDDSSRTTHPVSSVLIATKLLKPPIQVGMVYRERLIKKLATGKESRITLVSGKAGSGKTSLICQWIEKSNMAVGWYSLDETDNDLNLFLRYFLTALSNTDPELQKVVRPWLHGNKRFSGKEMIQHLIGHLMDMGGSIYLVLDDYHVITSKEIHDLLSYFLDHMPPQVHVIIISRYSILFPLSHFKMRGQMTEILPEDMLFTEDETASFVSEIMRVELSSEKVSELARHTEGWVGGLQLLRLSLEGRDKIPGDLNEIMGKAHREIAEYLIGEVISSLAEEVIEFLNATALLDRFTIDLCREIVKFPGVADILTWAHRSNLFLVSLDNDGEWYRYHNLFSDVIRKQVKTSTPKIYVEVLRKAALWFAKEGYLEDAFRHAFRSEDYEFAADLLEDCTLLFFERYEIISALRWLSKVPVEIYKRRALLRLEECGLKIESLQLATIEAVVDDIEARKDDAFQWYAGRKRKECENLLMYFKCIIPYYKDPIKADIFELRKTLQEIDPQGKTLFACFITDIITDCHLYTGDLGLAFDALQEESIAAFSSRSIWGRIIWSRSVMYAEMQRGRLNRAEMVAHEAFQFLNDNGLSDIPLKLLLYLPLAWIYYYKNDLNRALEFGNIGLNYMEKGVRSALHTNDGLMLLSLIYYGLGNEGATVECLEKMVSLSEDVRSWRMMAFTYAWAAHMSMARGSVEPALRWAHQRKPTVEKPFSVLVLRECLTYAEILYRKQQYREAAELLENLRQRCIERNLMHAVLEVDLLHSVILHALNEHDQALLAMGKALIFSANEGYIRPFVDCGAAILPILKKIAVSSRLATANPEVRLHLPTILKACGTDDNDGKGFDLTKDLLSQRELEILTLIAAGYRYNQIAEKLFVSLNTVKTHTSHIFEKLNVNTKDQAIWRAKELKLFV